MYQKWGNIGRPMNLQISGMYLLLIFMVTRGPGSLHFTNFSIHMNPPEKSRFLLKEFINRIPLQYIKATIIKASFLLILLMSWWSPKCWPSNRSARLSLQVSSNGTSALMSVTTQKKTSKCNFRHWTLQSFPAFISWSAILNSREAFGMSLPMKLHVFLQLACHLTIQGTFENKNSAAELVFS